MNQWKKTDCVLCAQDLFLKILVGHRPCAGQTVPLRHS